MSRYTSWGKAHRLSRIFSREGRTVMLAFDHGYFLGPVTGMHKPAEAVPPLAGYADALMLSPGILKTCICAEINQAVVLRASGGSSIATEDVSNEDVILRAEEAVKLDADAIALSFYIGTAHETQTLLALARAINDASRFELPVLAVTAVGRELAEKRDARFLALACRIAAEFGADIVKTYYCDGFERVTGTCPIPVVVAGGPKLETEKDVFDLVSNSIKLGAAGVDMGRNVWQNSCPVAMIRAIRAVVHDNLTSDDALAMYHELKQVQS